MNSVELANNLIDRAKNLKLFEVKRYLENGIMFDGSIPFDIKGEDDCYWIYVYAVTQEEAEAQIDAWLKDRT
jgi:hypothetical protein